MDIALSLSVVVVVCGLSSTCIGPRHPTPHASQVSFFYVGGSSIAGKGASDAHVSHASAPVAPHTWRTPAWEGKDVKEDERKGMDPNQGGAPPFDMSAMANVLNVRATRQKRCGARDEAKRTRVEGRSGG